MHHGTHLRPRPDDVEVETPFRGGPHRSLPGPVLPFDRHAHDVLRRHLLIGKARWRDQQHLAEACADVSGGPLIDPRGVHRPAGLDDPAAQGQLLAIHPRPSPQHGLAGPSPARYRLTSSAAILAAILTVVVEAPAICGVSVTLSSFKSGASGGGGSSQKVSSIA